VIIAWREEGGRASSGFGLTQRGKYGDGSGECGYVDSVGNLKVALETPESYR